MLIGKEWLPQLWLPLPDHPKAALCELNGRLRSIAQVPQSWAPAISRVSADCMRVLPRTHGEAQQHYADNGGVEDYVGMSLVPPRLAAVTLALGFDPDSPWAVGARLSASKANLIGEGCMLGAEFVGVRRGVGLVTTLLFAPISGRVFIKFPEENVGLVAQPLPALEDGMTDDGEPEVVEAFLCVGSDGATSFCRCRSGHEGVEWSGEIPREFFPSWARDRFASLNFQIDQLKVPAEVTTTWAGKEMPTSLASDRPLGEFDASWSEYAW